MKKIITLLCCFVFLIAAQATDETIYTDDFSETHDFVTDGVEGTIWDGISVNEGVIETEVEAEILELQSGDGVLTFNTMNSNFSGGNDNGAFLYKTIPADSDFQLIVKIESGQFSSFDVDPVGFLTAGLIARVPPEEDPDNARFVVANAFDRPEWGAVQGLRSVPPPEGGVEELWNAQHSVAAYPWMKLARAGNVFTAYYSADGHRWHLLNHNNPDVWDVLSVERPDMAGFPLQVGIFHATYSGNSASVDFANFYLRLGEDVAAPISTAFWDFNMPGFGDLLQPLYPTHMGEGFTLFNDAERALVLVMPGGHWEDAPDKTMIFEDVLGITGNDPRTIMFWMKAGKDEGVVPGDDNDVLFGTITQWGVNEDGERFTVRHNNGRLRVEVQGGFAQTASNEVISLHNWHHVIVQVPDVENATTDDIRIWIDGVAQETETATQLINTADSPFGFGHNRLTIGRTLFGFIDDFLIIPDAPSEGKIFGYEETTIAEDLGIDLVYPGMNPYEYVYGDDFLAEHDYAADGIMGAANIALISRPDTDYVSPWENLRAINSGYEEPENSGDRGGPNGVYGNWNSADEWRWVQYDFPGYFTIDRSDVYWFTDGGGILIPDSAHLEYWNGEEKGWVMISDDLGLVADQWNITRFDPVFTNTIRMHMKSNEQSTGIIEWRVLGTIWDGLKVNEGAIATDTEAEIVELTAGEGVLTFTTMNSHFSGGNDNGVFLYRNIPPNADFEAIVKIESGTYPSFDAEPVGFLMAGLMARVPTAEDPENARFICTQAFDRPEWGATHGLRNVPPPAGGIQELWNGEHSLGDYPWMKLVREGLVFTAYFSADGEEWHLFDHRNPDEWDVLSAERPDMVGFPLQVGIYNATYTENAGTVEFAHFTLSVGEEKVIDIPVTTIVDIIMESEVHATLATAVAEAGLADALTGEGPFTVFAPTDEAFEALPEGMLADLLADPEGLLKDILLYHVVDGLAYSNDLSDGQNITTMLGEDIVVTINEDGVFINGAQVIVADLEAHNGVVHVIDGVLEPAVVEVPDISTETKAVSLFPNPAKDMVTLYSTDRIREVTIVDISGRTVKQFVVDTHEVNLDTSALITGLYLVSVRTDMGVHTDKLQIQR